MPTERNIMKIYNVCYFFFVNDRNLNTFNAERYLNLKKFIIFLIKNYIEFQYIQCHVFFFQNVTY